MDRTARFACGRLSARIIREITGAQILCFGRDRSGGAAESCGHDGARQRDNNCHSDAASDQPTATNAGHNGTGNP